MTTMVNRTTGSRHGQPTIKVSMTVHELEIYREGIRAARNHTELDSESYHRFLNQLEALVNRHIATLQKPSNVLLFKKDQANG